EILLNQLQRAGLKRNTTQAPAALVGVGYQQRRMQAAAQQLLEQSAEPFIGAGQVLQVGDGVAETDQQRIRAVQCVRAPTLRLVQARAHDVGAELLADGEQQIALVGAELTRLTVVEGQRAERLLLVEQRHAQQRAEAGTAHQFAARAMRRVCKVAQVQRFA